PDAGACGAAASGCANPPRTCGNPLCGRTAPGLEWRPVPFPLAPREKSQMSSDVSVTNWINQLKAGEPEAARRLWDGYFRRLVGLARGKLEGSPRRAADEEDVALSAFGSLCRGAEGGRFPHLLDRDSLWQLLVAITAHKAHDLRRREERKKRGGGRVLDEAA